MPFFLLGCPLFHCHLTFYDLEPWSDAVLGPNIFKIVTLSVFGEFECFVLSVVPWSDYTHCELSTLSTFQLGNQNNNLSQFSIFEASTT